MSLQVAQDTYCLSPMQQGMLFHNWYTQQSGIDIEQIVCSIHEELNVPALKKAWDQVVQRHSALRTSFRWEGLEEPIQVVRQKLDPEVEEQDWRSLPSSTQEESQLKAYLKSDRQRGFQLDKPPLMRLALFQTGESQYKLIWTFPLARAAMMFLAEQELAQAECL